MAFLLRRKKGPMIRNAHFQISVFSLFSLLFSLASFTSPGYSKTVQTEIPSAVSTVTSDDISNIQSTKPITIMASRLPGLRENLRNRSANITYKDSKDLGLTQPLNFQDAVRDTEGLVFYDSVGNGLDQTISMRGFKNASDVIFLVDGVRVNEIDGGGMTYPLLRLSNIDSIQVDRGSGSPVYGSGAFAGVVNITTRQPSEKPVSLFGDAAWSSFRGIQFHQGISGTLKDNLTPIGGKWAYYFNGGRDVSHGFRANGDWKITDFDIKTSYTLPEDRAKIHAGVKHVYDDVSNPGEMTFQQYQDNPWRTNKPLDGRRFDQTIVSVGGDANALDKRFTTSILGSWRLNRMDSKTTFGTFTDFLDGWDPDTNLVVSKSRDEDLTWQMGYDDTWDWLGSETIFGLEGRRGLNQGTQRDAFGGVIQEAPAIETDREVHPENFGIFWRETLRFWDRVIPYFGMRHDFNWVQTEDRLASANNISKRWNASTVSTGVTVKTLSFLDLFGNYSTGFRVPTPDELAPFSGAISTNLNPEKSHSYEVGSRLFYKNLAALKNSWFWNDLKDEISFDSNAVTAASPFGQNINIAKTRRYGTELRLDLNPIQELNSYGSYAWTRAYVRETDSNGSLKDGRTLEQIPENRFTFGSFLTPLARLGEPYDGFKFGLDGIYTGPQHPVGYQTASQATLNTTGGAGHSIKGYTVWNFMTSFKWHEKEFYFRINNIFDERYYSRAVSSTSFGTSIYPAGTYNFVVPGAPREYVIGSKWEF